MIVQIYFREAGPPIAIGGPLDVDILGMLRDRIQSDLKAAMIAGEETKVSTLRMLLSALQYAEVAGREKQVLGEDAVIDIVNREVKKRSEAIEEYKKAGRADLVEKESQERVLLEHYLPQQLSDDELDALIQEAAAEVGAASETDFGKLMKIVTPKTKTRAHGSRVVDAVKRLLSRIPQ